MQFDCVNSLDVLLAIFPLLATLLFAAGSGQAAIEHSIWQTDFGPLVVAQFETQWFARYPEYEGVVVGEVSPGMVDGLWIQPKSDQQCTASVPLQNPDVRAGLPSMQVSEQSRHWGGFKASFAQDRFEGQWNYCGLAAKPGRWRGTLQCRVTLVASP